MRRGDRFLFDGVGCCPARATVRPAVAVAVTVLALVEQPRAVDLRRLSEPLDRLATREQRAVDEALGPVPGLERLT
jgi:hypothetical protein